MALWDNMDNIFGSGKASGGRAGQAYFDPYVQGGGADYARYRGDIGKLGDQLDSYGNPADWMWRNAGTSPQDYYQQMMEGYTETPQAQYEMEQMQNQVDRGSSASGMLGSGAYYKALQENAGNIIARDQDRYFGNMLRGNDQQMKYLDDFRRMQKMYYDSLYGSSRMGMDAANQAAQYANQSAQGDSDIWGGVGDFLGGIAQGASLFF